MLSLGNSAARALLAGSVAFGLSPTFAHMLAPARAPANRAALRPVHGSRGAPQGWSWRGPRRDWDGRRFYAWNWRGDDGWAGGGGLSLALGPSFLGRLWPAEPGSGSAGRRRRRRSAAPGCQRLSRRRPRRGRSPRRLRHPPAEIRRRREIRRRAADPVLLNCELAGTRGLARFGDGRRKHGGITPAGGGAGLSYSGRRTC